MFQTYFQLQRRPFACVPSPEHYFPCTSMETARSSLVRLIERQEGPGLVIGQVGVGKSLLCQLLAESFRHLCRVVVLPSGRLCTRRSILQVILYELGLPYRDLDEGELRLTLIDHLTSRDLCPNGMLLLVDEADCLTLALLDELRGLTNLSVEGQPCVRMILFGTPRLEEKFAHPRLESFNQRLAGRFYLQPLPYEETRCYIEQQFADSGGDPRIVFTSDAFAVLHRATGGIPRLINQLTDHALVIAAADNYPSINAACVEEAWADLQQLPTPFERGGRASQVDLPSDIIEFGELVESTRDAELNVESQLSQLESHLAIASSDEPTLGNPPHYEINETRPEVTLYFHPAHNPFGDDYDEEELVIDELIAPAILARRHHRQVRSAQSFDLARYLDHRRAAEPNDMTQDDVAEDQHLPTEADDLDSVPFSLRLSPTLSVSADNVCTVAVAPTSRDVDTDPATDSATAGPAIVPLDNRDSFDEPNPPDVSPPNAGDARGVVRAEEGPAQASPHNFRRLFTQLRHARR